MTINVSENTFVFQQCLFKVSLSCLSIRREISQTLKNLLLLDANHCNLPKITLYSLQSPLGYRSAIAIQLTKGQKLSLTSFLKQFVNNLSKNNLEQSDFPTLDFTVRVWETGWIDFYPSDRALAIWLQQLLQYIELPDVKPVKEEISPNLFVSQYAHARCCSLLRLAHREGLIQLNNLWQWEAPHPISWCHCEKLQLVHLQEQHLIGQILAIVDELDNVSVQTSIKLAINLGQSVLEFDRHCRIWGEVKTEMPQLSQARLGLIAIAQLLLQKLLQEKIGIWAPVEL
jgi:DALR anticodon binding domain